MEGPRRRDPPSTLPRRKTTLLRIVRLDHPIDNRRTIDRIEGRDRIHDIESPAAISGITGIPNGQNEMSGLTFTARPTSNHVMEILGIKVRRIPPPKFRLQTRKRAGQGKNIFGG